MLMTFADRTCGMTARYVSGKPTLATVQLDTHFVEAGKIGEILISKPHVVRSTRSLIFITTEVTVDKRCIAMASGVFKILKNESSELPSSLAVIAERSEAVRAIRMSGLLRESAHEDRYRYRCANDSCMRTYPCNTATSAAAA